jgi:hypothetical protein
MGRERVGECLYITFPAAAAAAAAAVVVVVVEWWRQGLERNEHV